MAKYEICEGYLPGLVGRMTELHAIYYGSLWKLGPRFEGEVAEGVGEFVGRYDPSRDGLWTVAGNDGTVMGSIVIDSRAAGEDGAQLRYFILDPDLHGNGFGRALLAKAVDFCERQEFDRVFLWTVDELEAAIGLYREAGFRSTDEIDVHTGWRTDVPYRLFEREL